MQARIKWLEPSHQILYILMPKKWTWDDMILYNKRINRLLNRYSRPAVIVLDFHESTYLPPNAVINCRKIFSNIHPDSGEIMLVGLPLSHKLVLDVVFRLFPHLKQYIFDVDMFEHEMLALLEEPTIEESPEDQNAPDASHDHAPQKNPTSTGNLWQYPPLDNKPD